MTLVVGLVSPEYAAVLADTRSIIRGPARLPLFGQPLPTDSNYRTDSDGCLVLDPEESLTIDGPHPLVDKVRFLGAAEEAVAFAGTRDLAEAFVGLDGATRAFEADEQISRHFSGKASLERVLDLAQGEYDSWSALHVYQASERSIVAKFDASPVHLCRWYVRSSRDELRYAAIGSGARHIEKLVPTEDAGEPWETIRRNVGREALDEVLAFWVPLFHHASQLESDVNALVRVWKREYGEDAFSHYRDLTVIPGSA